MQDLVGQVVGERYRVLRGLGRGAMGLLYEVENVKIGRKFALKTLTSELARKTESLARFRREAEIIARLNHPNVIAIVDWDALPDGAPFYVMELLEGEDLGERIARAPLGLEEFGTIAAQAMAAVAEAHRHGVLHRDLKPANLFLCRVPDAIHVKVLDFGLARAGGVPAITAYDRPMWIGTPAYMSPEQIVGEAEPGQKADVWAMGAVLFEMLTGRQAYPGPLDQVVAEIRKGDPPRVRALRGDAPPELADVIESALSRDPERRITTIDDLAARVRAVLASVGAGRPAPISSPPPIAEARTARSSAPPAAAPAQPVMSAAETKVDSPRSGAARRRVRAWVWVAFASALVAVASVVVAVVAMSGGEGGDEKPSAAEPPAPAATSKPAESAKAASPTPSPTPTPTSTPTPTPTPTPSPTPTPTPSTSTSTSTSPGKPASTSAPASTDPITTAYPDDPNDGMMLDLVGDARVQRNLGNFEKATLLYKRAYDFSPHPEILFEIAGTHHEAGQCEEARFFYKRFISLAPTSPNHDAAERGILECGAPEPAAPPAKGKGKKKQKAGPLHPDLEAFD